MIHLSNQQLYGLSEKIVNQEPFNSKDVKYMYHVEQCDDCYTMLRATMVAIDVTNRMGEIVSNAHARSVPAAINHAVSALIKLTVGTINSTIAQISSPNNAWEFDRPLMLAGARSVGSTMMDSQKLEDIDNSSTFIVYDHKEKHLFIQLEQHSDTNCPQVLLRKPDNTVSSVELKKNGPFYSASIHNLDEGEYEILLKK